MMQNEKNETTNPFRGQSPDCHSKITRKTGRNASNSLSKSRKRSGSKNTKLQGKRLKTCNFFNQTMAQIVQGKDRELFPLVDKKKIPNAHSFGMEQPHL